MAVTRTFETARLLAKCVSVEEVPAVQEAIAESLGELKPWLDWAQKVPEYEASKRHAQQSEAAFRTGERFLFNLFLKEAGDFICRLELRPSPKWIQEIVGPGDWWEFGYWCRSKCTGQGYMSEGLIGAMHWAMSQLGLAWFVIRTDSQSIRSQALAGRIGFKMTKSRPTTFLNQPRVEHVYEKRVLP